MSVIKKIFAFAWGIWGALWFMLIVAPLTIIYALILLVGGKKYSLHCVWFNCHYVCPFLLRVMLIQVKEYGREKIQSGKAMVFVSNHLSALDILVNASVMPQPMRFLAKMETKYIPFFGYMVKMLAIVVDRKSKESREKSYRYMSDALQQGESLIIYPEGTRNRTGVPLKEFKDGAFRVAVMAQVPIIVQTLVGTQAVNPPEGLQLLPGTVEVHWSEPIETTGMLPEDIAALKQRVRTEMLKHLP